MQKLTYYSLQCLDFDDSKLFATKQQLKEAEKTDNGKIKWENFDRIVNRVRNEIAELIENYKSQSQKQMPDFKKRDIFKYCVYNMYTKELIGEYQTAESASLAMGLPKNTASNSMAVRCGIYQKAGLIFTRVKIGEKQVKPLKKQVRPVKNEKPCIRAYSLSTNELIGTYSSIKNVALDLDISIKSVENSLYRSNGVYKKRNLRFVRENS